MKIRKNYHDYHDVFLKDTLIKNILTKLAIFAQSSNHHDFRGISRGFHFCPNKCIYHKTSKHQQHIFLIWSNYLFTYLFFYLKSNATKIYGIEKNENENGKKPLQINLNKHVTLTKLTFKNLYQCIHNNILFLWKAYRGRHCQMTIEHRQQSLSSQNKRKKK